MVSLVLTLKPQIFLHECTQLFPGVPYFQRLIGSLYTVHHKIVDPREHGCPVRRSRAYDGCVRNDFTLPRGMSDFHRMYASTSLNAGVFLQADEKEATVVTVTISLQFVVPLVWCLACSAFLPAFTPFFLLIF